MVKNTCKKLQVVLGNEACDLDSAVSAITYAFLLHSLRTEPEGSDDAPGVIPVLNIARRDFPLRTEVTFWLRRHGVPQEALVF
ncbi:exopolyphosphatase PRUNE1-like, partial [Penaeus japonicus]|uniref:exopolyphosphatase PRUNE1-like n=1 Tax=Penaeus japonicus TaxID=27405 RepID=UPI001C714C02